MSTVLLFMEVTIFLENTNSTFLKLIKSRKENLKRLIALSYKIVQCQILFLFQLSLSLVTTPNME